MSAKVIFYIKVVLSKNKALWVFRNVLLLLFIYWGALLKAQSTAEGLTAALSTAYKQNDFPGFSVAIVNSDSILYENAFGFADLEKKIPYTTTTVQPIASLSKLFIGMAVMKAIEQGLFTLDTDINSILPFKVTHPYSPEIPIALKHLVTHTSGITDNADTYKKTYLYNVPIQEDNPIYGQLKSKGYGAEGKDTTLAAFLTDYLSPSGSYYSKKNFSKSAPGKRYEYSNIGSDLAAWLIELKSSMSFSQYTQKHILQPLQMTHATWSTADADQEKLSALYTGDDKPYPKYSSVAYPDGGLTTSCHELSLFLNEVIAGQQGKGQILSPASYATMLQPAFSDSYKPENLDPAEPNIGVFYAIKKSGVIGHSGSDGGVTAFLFFNPVKGYGMLFLANTEMEGLNGINKNLMTGFEKMWGIMGQYAGKLQSDK
ncbi:serine hydrolase domain-containing protein [Sphingobacterium detergens]|uniref:CubicO group peptidase (Beta-lactamase class C family) n=1 Tax=Sphingobacterium detergens TaxID=1145106 RepID=A0A420ARS0_SPHD1|nr:serine hydrolase domain-containing protein [Sphingobacterium detergens]RKE47117.1 CubicO group peptidase (beta-lactamase class C family) [Sphingobacterium detergens]